MFNSDWNAWLCGGEKLREDTLKDPAKHHQKRQSVPQKCPFLPPCIFDSCPYLNSVGMEDDVLGLTDTTFSLDAEQDTGGAVSHHPLFGLSCDI